MGKRLIILSFAAAAIAFGVFVFSISRQNGEKAETAEESQFPGSGQAKNIAGYKLNESAEGANWTPGSPKEPDFKPYFKIEEDKIAETFLSRFDALLSSSGSSVASQTDVSQGQSLPPIVQPTSFSASQGKKKVTDEEWFKIAYPEPYIQYLANMENIMRETGFLAEGERFEFSSAEGVRIFLNRVADWFVRDLGMSKEEEESFRNGINVILPSLHKREKALYEQSLGFLNSVVRFTRSFGPIFELAKIAYAQAESYSPDCYRTGSPGGAIGYNLPAPCCNCGWLCTPSGCVFRQNCGYRGAGCNIDLGCLNGVCPGRPAIWDGGPGVIPPASNICGCG